MVQWDFIVWFNGVSFIESMIEIECVSMTSRKMKGFSVSVLLVLSYIIIKKSYNEHNWSIKKLLNSSEK